MGCGAPASDRPGDLLCAPAGWRGRLGAGDDDRPGGPVVVCPSVGAVRLQTRPGSRSAALRRPGSRSSSQSAIRPFTERERGDIAPPDAGRGVRIHEGGWPAGQRGSGRARVRRRPRVDRNSQRRCGRVRRRAVPRLQHKAGAGQSDHRPGRGPKWRPLGRHAGPRRDEDRARWVRILWWNRRHREPRDDTHL